VTCLIMLTSQRSIRSEGDMLTLTREHGALADAHGDLSGEPRHSREIFLRNHLLRISNTGVPRGTASPKGRN